MSARQVSVSAPSRLHFGLLRFANPEGRSFGGLGLMIDRPRVELSVTPAKRWSASGPCSTHVLLSAARGAAAAIPGGGARCFSVDVVATPPRHVGLGVGTQVALSVAAGVYQSCGLPLPEAWALATCVDRGQRSAVGSHGFYRGGLIFEQGYLPGEPIGRLASRTALPEAWRILVVRMQCRPGKSGQPEKRAFEQLPPIAAEVSAELVQLATEEIVPAAHRADIEAFGKALYQFGWRAGRCFASVQGGPFASGKVAAAVERLREMGAAGVGQSSWGPSVFAVTENQGVAERLQAQCEADPAFQGAAYLIAAPDNHGARISAGA